MAGDRRRQFVKKKARQSSPGLFRFRSGTFVQPLSVEVTIPRLARTFWLARMCAVMRQADGRAVLDTDDNNGLRVLTNETSGQTCIEPDAPGE